MTADIVSLADRRNGRARDDAGGMTPPDAANPYKPRLKGDRALQEAERDIHRLAMWVEDRIVYEHMDTEKCKADILGARRFVIDTPAEGIAGACVKLRMAMACGSHRTAMRLVAEAHKAIIAKGGDKWRCQWEVWLEKKPERMQKAWARLEAAGLDTPVYSTQHAPEPDGAA